ncbi:MAG: zinc metalloprotease [Bacteroidetes bacterium]|nr:zinc metalloprotease [Bacteroidota bacterium]
MKKLILTIALVFALLQINAQTQYDTIVFHPYDLSECPMGLSIYYHEDKARYCDSCIPPLTTLPGTTIPCYIDGSVTGRNQYGVQGVAQPYHFDSTVTVIGIAVKIGNGSLDPSLNGTVFFRIMDEGFNELGQSSVYPWQTPDSNGYKRHWFSNEISLRDFYLAGDILSYNQHGFNINYLCTWSLYDSTGCLENLLTSRGLPYDTIFVGINYDNPDPWATVTDTLIACRFEESPWLKKDNKWVRFADDPVYNIFQKTFIEFLPILKVQRLSLPEEISNDNTIKLYPNPAENTLNIESQEIIKEIEFYDALGKKAKAITLNRKEATIDISSLAKGNYVVNLITDKGKITKKLVVK